MAEGVQRSSRPERVHANCWEPSTSERICPVDFRQVGDGLDAAALDDLAGVYPDNCSCPCLCGRGPSRRLYPASDAFRALSSADLQHAGSGTWGGGQAAVSKARRTSAQRQRAGQIRWSHQRRFRVRQQGGDLQESDSQTGGICPIVIPDIVAAFEDWPKAVADARDLLALGTEPHNVRSTNSTSLDRSGLLVGRFFGQSWRIWKPN